MIDPSQLKRVDPFEVFMAKVAGKHFLFQEDGYRLEGYQYKGIAYITSFTAPPKLTLLYSSKRSQ
jgi:hypothetical protein